MGLVNVIQKSNALFANYTLKTIYDRHVSNKSLVYESKEEDENLCMNVMTDYRFKPLVGTGILRPGLFSPQTVFTITHMRNR